MIDEKYDQVVDKIINDIMSTFKEKRGGRFVLPEDISEELVYDYYHLNDKFNDLMENKNNYENSKLKDLLYIQFVDLMRYHKYNGQKEGEKLERLHNRIERLKTEMGE